MGLVKSLQQSASETALCVDIRYFDKPPIQTTSVPVYLVNIEWGQICTNSKSLCKASGYIFYVHTVM